MTLDIKKIREEFPILDSKVRNGNKLVYLDNAATTLKPKAVIHAVETHYKLETSNVHRGVHYFSENASLKYENSRSKIQKFLNAKETSEIIFTSGTTASINLVAQSWGKEFLNENDEVLISHLEHHSNIVPWQMVCKEKKAKLKVIPMNSDGDLVLEKLHDLITPKTKMVAVTYVSNAIGTINDIEKIIETAHKFGALVLIDGAQAVSHIPIDLQKLNCDFFALSGHKLVGPTGVGVLYGKKEHLEKMPPFMGGGSMIRSVSFEETTYAPSPAKFEAGTPPIAGAIGLGEAVDYIQSIGLDQIYKYEMDLLQYATQKLSQVEGLKIFGTSKKKAPIISFTIDTVHPHDLATLLDEEGVAIRAGHHCCQPIMNFYDLPATSRASFAFYNTIEEVDQLYFAILKAKSIFS